MRVLQHYGVEDLERTPAMEAAVFRIFLAQQRSTLPPEEQPWRRCRLVRVRPRQALTAVVISSRRRSISSAVGLGSIGEPFAKPMPA